MDNTSVTEKLDRLKQLLFDYSFPERITEDMLPEIDTLLTWAIQSFVSPGATQDEVNAYLGDPFIEVGGDAGISDWLYPCESPDNHVPSVDLEGSWYYDLRFNDNSLISIMKKKWRFTK